MNPLLSLVAVGPLLIGEPSTSAQTTVELRVTSVDDGEAKLLEQALLRDIGDRLLEDGYRLVPAGASASVRVWIHLGTDSATIDGVGDGHVRERVADAEPEIMLLELQQLSTALIDEVRPASVRPVEAVVVEIVGDEGDPQLRTRLQAGLLERGFALTRVPDGEDLRLCVHVEADGVYVHARAGFDACAESRRSAVRVGDAAELEIARALVLDQAVASIEGVRSTAEPEPEPREPASEPSVAEDLPPVADEPSPTPQVARERSRPSVAIVASGGVLGRGGGADPLVGVGLRGGLRRGLGGGLELELVPSQAGPLRVFELVPTASFDWRLGFADRGLAILGVFAGAHVHRYRYADSSVAPGTRVGPSVGASVRLAYLGRRGALLFGGVRAGWSGGRWIHLADGAPSWRRSGVVVGVELGVGWDFEVGGRR